MNYHTHLECTKSGEHYPTDKPRNAVPGGLLYARYDLKRIKSEVSRDVVKEGPASLWRYGPLLPIAVEKAVTLGEGFTPLLQAPVLGAKLGCADVWVKDEGGNPSGCHCGKVTCLNGGNLRGRHRREMITSQRLHCGGIQIRNVCA